MELLVGPCLLVLTNLCKSVKLEIQAYSVILRSAGENVQQSIPYSAAASDYVMPCDSCHSNTECIKSENLQSEV